MVRVFSSGVKKSGAMTDENRKAEAKKSLVHKVEKSEQSARARSFQLRHYNHLQRPEFHGVEPVFPFP